MVAHQVKGFKGKSVVQYFLGIWNIATFQVLFLVPSYYSEGMQFFEDFSKTTVDHRKENIPELIKQKKEGKKYF